MKCFFFKTSSLQKIPDPSTTKESGKRVVFSGHKIQNIFIPLYRVTRITGVKNEMFFLRNEQFPEHSRPI